MAMMTNKLRGMGVALVTPMLPNGEIDFDGLGKLLDHQINAKTDFLVSLGTTGEAATLSDQERYAVLDYTLKHVDDRLPIVAGYGGNDTAHVLKAMNEFSPERFLAILSVTPYYNKPNQRGLYAHYAAIAKSCPVPIILYNVPSRTGANMSASTTLQLAHDFDNIVAIKEASGNMEQCMEIVRTKPKDFITLSGDDLLTFPLVSLGFDGVISVLGNAYPAKFRKMVWDLREGNIKAAQIGHYDLLVMAQLIFEDGNPAGVKSALKHLGVCNDNLRLPLINVGPELEEKIAKEVARLVTE